MSSCFLCDCSYRFAVNDDYNVVYAEGQQEKYYMKQMPIIIGSTGTNTDDQQHKDNNKQNYVSYRVKKIEFRLSSRNLNAVGLKHFPDYIILFKVPFREPIFDYYFTIMKNFILFSEPECVLSYRVVSDSGMGGSKQYFAGEYDLIINKPFIVGPNDYVGVLYFFGGRKEIDASARVWFDVV